MLPYGTLCCLTVHYVALQYIVLALRYMEYARTIIEHNLHLLHVLFLTAINPYFILQNNPTIFCFLLTATIGAIV